MKQFFKILTAAALIACVCFAFAACKDGDGTIPDEDDKKDELPDDTKDETLDRALFVGEYELYSLTCDYTDDDGKFIVYTVGETVPARVAGNAQEMTLAPDYQTITLNADGTFTWVNKYTMSDYINFNNLVGTWKTTATGATVSVTEFSYDYTATIEDGKLTMTYENDVNVFTKK